ncbi:hypothetical protein MPDQ_002926 [Monascus purpureus]|uniref:DNA endonuclease activator Ctp1 C-terminal domain-containing protein n=1 Tax=Monascus purpureus TaxID=5098 RepID=A0A507QLM4_MONPU|nr:hypothetical protein MPDQ_002926 [Monascus purpureus]BDD57260.1 hypothetical protein MAP00_002643 [Monascus purpureus]
MDPKSRTSPSPSKVLSPLSSQRMNRQATPDSHTLPSDLLQLQRKNSNGISDVQSKVARLNSMAHGNRSASSVSSSGTNAALQRAIVGREEAESALASVSAQLSEAQSRERRISERLESLLEELHSAKERQTHERTIFEKEIRKARKEAFRASSILVKVQEDLKASKEEVVTLKDEVRLEQEAKENATKEASERADTITCLTEEIRTLKEKINLIESNNALDALESRETRKKNAAKASSAKAYDASESPCQGRTGTREESGRRASSTRGNAAVDSPAGSLKRASESAESPFSDDEDFSDVYSITPLKRQRVWSEFVTPKEDEDTIGIDSPTIKILELRAKLQWEKKLRAEAERTIEFMCIECQFKACRCRIAESEGREYIYDFEYHEKQKAAERAKKEAELSNERDQGFIAPETENRSRSHSPSNEAAKPETGHDDKAPEEELLITFSPETGTFRTIPSPVRSPGKSLESDKPAVSRPEYPQPFEIDLLTQSPIKVEKNNQSRFECASKITAPSHDLFSPTPPSRTVAEGHTGLSLLQEDSFEGESNADEHPTTTKVPLRMSEDSSANSFLTPGTPISREAALAQIRARRGKTRSMTRCVSAGEGNLRSGGMGVTPLGGARRIPGLHTKANTGHESGERRDISAPMRLFRR